MYNLPKEYEYKNILVNQSSCLKQKTGVSYSTLAGYKMEIDSSSIYNLIKNNETFLEVYRKLSN